MNTFPISELTSNIDVVTALLKLNLMMQGNSQTAVLMSLLTGQPLPLDLGNNLSLNAIAATLMAEQRTLQTKDELSTVESTPLDLSSATAKIFKPQVIFNTCAPVKADPRIGSEEVINQARRHSSSKLVNAPSIQKSYVKNVSPSGPKSLRIRQTQKSVLSGEKRSASDGCSSTNANEDCKESKLTRRNSFSTDQCSQDLEKRPSPESTLVFIVRRYSKKHRKFILLTRHRNLITK